MWLVRVLGFGMNVSSRQMAVGKQGWPRSSEMCVNESRFWTNVARLYGVL